MNYATGAAFNLDELFINFDLNKLKLTSKVAEKMTKGNHRKDVVKRVFREALKLILNDVVDNNVTFELPTGARYSCIHVLRTQGDDFIKARQNGKWQDVDYLESNFSGNLIVFEFQTSKVTKQVPIYVNRELKDKLTENTNKGKQYC